MKKFGEAELEAIDFFYLLLGPEEIAELADEPTKVESPAVSNFIEEEIPVFLKALERAGIPEPEFDGREIEGDEGILLKIVVPTQYWQQAIDFAADRYRTSRQGKQRPDGRRPRIRLLVP